MKLREILGKKRIYFDGGMGTLLQKAGLKPGELPELWNVTHSDIITNIHLDYLKAGSNVITTNTFGANSLKFGNLEEIISAAVNNAKKAITLFGKEDCFVAFDVGPLGKMLEPLGELPFEEAVSIFSKSISLGAKYGADLIIIETMNDSYETKAAVIAAKESCNLPVFVTNVFDENLALMTGADPKAMIALLESLSVDAIGMNCSLGPKQMIGIVKEYVKYSSLPVIVNPNAGLPTSQNGETVFDITKEQFAEYMTEIAFLGASVLGGCCGTTPEYISLMKDKTKDIPYVAPEKKNYTFVSSYTHAVTIGNEPVLIGERINPTGKPKLKAALRENNMAYIIAEAVSQQEKGAHILDVNVGLPEIDEEKMICQTVCELQAVTDLPLQIDSVKPSAIEKALRIYNGKPLINSVNGKKESMDSILPLVKKYGGVLIALTIDENGIPDTAEGRYEIAKKIVLECAKYGIDKKDIIVDPLAMTVSANDNSALVTLQSIVLIKERLGVKTSLGVSNVSFGLPMRDTVNAQFLSLAFAKGLDCAIMNPNSTEMMSSYYIYRALSGMDSNCMNYIDFASNVSEQALCVSDAKKETQGNTNTLFGVIVKGIKQSAFDLATEYLKTKKPLEIIDEDIVPALDAVGKGFEEKTVYLPGLLMSAEAASRAFEVVKNSIGNSESEVKGKIILATVKGDIHDIGKNIVKVLLQNYGFEVIDLGKDVEPKTVVEAARLHNVKLVGLSALMTTTTEAMAETVKLLSETLPGVKTVVGGAVLTKEYAAMIGATHYAKDAMETVRFAQSVFETE